MTAATGAPGFLGRLASRAGTLRWRLTLLFGGLVLAAGLALVVLDYALVRSGLEASTQRVTVPVVNQFGQRFDVPVTPEQGLEGTPLGDFLRDARAELRQDVLDTLLQRSLLALALVGGTALVVAYLVAGRVLRPLQQITATAQRLSTETLDQRIALAGPDDELKELANTFDDMLSRLEGAFDSQLRFVANASHELRTPLAVMRTEVDVALADPHASTAELRSMGVVVREATQRADRLVDSLLLLARSDSLPAGRPTARERLDLGELAATAMSAVAADARARNLRVEVAYGTAPVLGDRGLLERLAGNLVENGIRHNDDGGWLSVRTWSAGPRVLLAVASTGPLVPPEEAAGLFEPFRRLGTARTARRGAGLGLSIVRSVANAHGGVAFARARPGGGLEVTVDLPRSP